MASFIRTYLSKLLLLVLLLHAYQQAEAVRASESDSAKRAGAATPAPEDQEQTNAAGAATNEGDERREETDGVHEMNTLSEESHEENDGLHETNTLSEESHEEDNHDPHEGFEDSHSSHGESEDHEESLHDPNEGLEDSNGGDKHNEDEESHGETNADADPVTPEADVNLEPMNCKVAEGSTPEQALAVLQGCVKHLESWAAAARTGRQQSEDANKAYMAEYKEAMALLAKIGDDAEMRKAFKADQEQAYGELQKQIDDIHVTIKKIPPAGYLQTEETQARGSSAIEIGKDAHMVKQGPRH